MSVAIENSTTSQFPILDLPTQPIGAATLPELVTLSPLAAELFARWQHNQFPWLLPLPVRRRIALALAASQDCPQRLAIHRQRASACSLTRAELDANQRGSSQDARAERALEFALAVAQSRGCITPTQWQRVLKAGLREAELIEIVALVGMNLLEFHLASALPPASPAELPR